MNFFLFLGIITIYINLNEILIISYLDQKTKHIKKHSQETQLIYYIMLFFSVFFTIYPPLLKKIRTGKNKCFTLKENMILVCVCKKSEILSTEIKEKKLINLGEKIQVQVIIGENVFIAKDKHELYSIDMFVTENQYRRIKLDKIKNNIKPKKRFRWGRKGVK